MAMGVNAPRSNGMLRSFRSDGGGRYARHGSFRLPAVPYAFQLDQHPEQHLGPLSRSLAGGLAESQHRSAVLRRHTDVHSQSANGNWEHPQA